MPSDQPVEFSCNTCSADGCVHDTCQALARVIVDHVQHANTPTIAELVVQEIHAPTLIDPTRHDHWLTCYSRATLWLAFAHLQPLFAIDAMRLLVISPKAFSPQQDVDARMAKPTVTISQFLDLLPQHSVTRLYRSISNRGAVGLNKTTCSSLTQAKSP